MYSSPRQKFPDQYVVQDPCYSQTTVRLIAKDKFEVSLGS